MTDLLEALLAKLFTDRQTVVDPGVIAFLGRRMERSFASARALVEALDREALAAKGPITRAVAARVLATNPASIRVLDHVGLTQVWRGVPRDRTLVAADVERIVFSDRRLSAETRDGLIALG